MSLALVDPRFIDSIWPEVAGMLQSAVDADKSYMTLDQLQLLIRRQALSMLIWREADGCVTGVATVEFINHPLKRVAFFQQLAGRAVVRRDVLGHLAAWCKDNGAVAIEGWGRESIMRLYRRLGFTECARVVRLEL